MWMLTLLVVPHDTRLLLLPARRISDQCKSPSSPALLESTLKTGTFACSLRPIFEPNLISDPSSQTPSQDSNSLGNISACIAVLYSGEMLRRCICLNRRLALTCLEINWEFLMSKRLIALTFLCAGLAASVGIASDFTASQPANSVIEWNRTLCWH